MTNIINVDFKNKCKIAEHTTYQWVDAFVCKTTLTLAELSSMMNLK